MSYSHSELVSRFAKGATKGRSCSMFIEDATLYSYGHHFPLLIRMPQWGENGKPGYMLNADKYSVTTSQHQAHCRHLATIQIPFSALQEALGVGISRTLVGCTLCENLNLIDKGAERWDTVPGFAYWKPTGKMERCYDWKKKEDSSRPARKRTTISNAEFHSLFRDEQEHCQGRKERRPESAVLRYKGKYYLSSMDGFNYFISLLPRAVKAVEEAFASLIPKEAQGKEYKRQGEWFFVPSEVPKVEISGCLIEKQATLKSRVNPTGHHYVRDLVTRPRFKNPLVRGTVRHTEKDHGMLKLGEMWHVAVESRHKGSWGASGQVD